MEKMDCNDAKAEKESSIRLFFIVLGSFVLYFNSWGMAQSFGVMYIELRDKFGGTKSEAAWVQSLFGGILLATGISLFEICKQVVTQAGPVTGILLNRFGCRLVAVVGSLILFAGLLASVFIPSLPVLYATYGVVGGIGGSLLFTTAGVVVLEHFDKRASLAVGIAGSGASAGTIVIPLLTHACIDAYGFRGAFLILSGVSLQCLVVALTFTPPPITIQDKTDIIDDKEEKSREAGPKSMFSFINRGYVVFASSWAIMMLPFLVPFLFLPDAAIAAGVNKQEAAFIASSMGLGSMTGRAGFGFLGDIKRLETTIMHIVPITLFGTLTLLYNFVQGFHNFLVLAIFIGLLSAIFDGIHPVITLQLVGPSNIGVGLGVLYFLMSVTTVVGTPIAGWISEVTGRYDEALYYCAGLSFLAAAIALYIPCWKRRHNK